MTIHTVVTFFDDISADKGIIIGSDTANSIDNAVKLDLPKVIYAEKKFTGKNYIGIHAGSYPVFTVPEGNPVGEVLRNNGSHMFWEFARNRFTINTMFLQNAFDEIEDGRDYGDHDFFKVLNERDLPYLLNIAVKKETSIGFYSMSNQTDEQNRNKSKLIHTLNGQADSEKSVIWYTAPHEKLGQVTNFRVDLPERLTLDKAKKLCTHTLQNGFSLPLGYDSGEPALYVASFNQLGPLEKQLS